MKASIYWNRHWGWFTWGSNRQLRWVEINSGPVYLTCRLDLSGLIGHKVAWVIFDHEFTLLF